MMWITSARRKASVGSWVIRTRGPGEAVEMLGEHPTQLDPRGDVERGERLIEEQEIGFGHQRSGQCDPLSLAAGQRPRLAPGLVGDFEPLQPFLGSR